MQQSGFYKSVIKQVRFIRAISGHNDDLTLKVLTIKYPHIRIGKLKKILDRA